MPWMANTHKKPQSSSQSSCVTLGEVAGLFYYLPPQVDLLETLGNPEWRVVSIAHLLCIYGIMYHTVTVWLVGKHLILVHNSGVAMIPKPRAGRNCLQLLLYSTSLASQWTTIHVYSYDHHKPKYHCQGVNVLSIKISPSFAIPYIILCYCDCGVVKTVA